MLSPELDAEPALTGLGTREGSWDGAAGSWGMFTDDRARWMEAAEGTVALGPGRLGPLLGLTSVLLLRDRRSDLAPGPKDVLRLGGRAGEVSREDCGEAVVDGEPDTFSDRTPLSVWGRMGPEPGALSAAAGVDAGAGALEAVGVVEVEDEVELAVGVLAAGSADSAAPVTERKPASLSSVIVDDVRAWGRGPAGACCERPVVAVEVVHRRGEQSMRRSNGQTRAAVRPARGARSLAGAAAGRKHRRLRDAVAAGGRGHLLAEMGW